jgi:hypothetical protein
MNKKLIKAVKDQLGEENEEDFINTLGDVCDAGASAGFGRFIYYSDTCKFYQNNKREIVKLAKEMADDFGQDVVSMIAEFRCLTDDKETRDEIGRAIYGTPEDDDIQVQNALAWFALEEVARFVTDN